MITKAIITNMNNALKSSPISRSRYPLGFTIFLSYMEFGYYFGFIPFRIEYNEAEGHYIVTVNRVQKVITQTLVTLSSLYSIFWFSCTIVNPASGAVQFFEVGKAFCSMFYAAAFLHLTLFMRDKVKDLLELMKVKGQYMEKVGELQKRGMILIIIAFYLCFGTFYMWYFNNNIRKENLLSKLIPNYDNDTENPFLIIWILKRVLDLLYYFYRSAGESPSVLIFSFGLYLHHMCEDLRGHIAQGTMTCQEMLQDYLQIKKINEAMNSITKYIAFLYVIGTVPFISGDIIELSFEHLVNIFSIIFESIGFLLCMLGSAEAHAKAGELKQAFTTRIHEDNTSGHQKEGSDTISTQLLLNELTSCEIGLKGIHFFTVTYSFTGTMLSQCIVYALIVLQLKMGDSEEVPGGPRFH